MIPPRVHPERPLARKACVFCGGGEPWAKEHVLPEWVAQQLRVGRLDVKRDHFSEPDRFWQKVGSFGLTAREVCKACNSGWMSDLENAVRPFMVRVLLAEGTVTLSPDEQVVLVAWLWKTAILHERAGPHRYFSTEERQCLRRGDAPPSGGVLVWIGCYKGTRVAKISGGPSTFKAHRGEKYPAMQMTLRLGPFAAHVLALRPRDGVTAELASRYDFRTAEIQIWPERGDTVTWPPRQALEDETFQAWHDRWNARLLG
jgi:hypothetical protein